jgi:hypothetical protein
MMRAASTKGRAPKALRSRVCGKSALLSNTKSRIMPSGGAALTAFSAMKRRKTLESAGLLQQPESQFARQLIVAKQRTEVEEDRGVEQRLGLRRAYPLGEAFAPFLLRQAPGTDCWP